jgi:muconolactone delta-isomerase
MKILALETDVAGVSEGAIAADLLKQEAARVWELHQAGLIREIYFRADQHKAVLILQCTDAEHANAVLGTLPLVRQHLIAFEIVPLTAYPGFARLFDTTP